jgi:very-short-patch-repair endonuclease
MNLEKLTNEELMKNYQRLAKRLRNYLTDEEVEYKKKIKEELLKRIG